MTGVDRLRELARAQEERSWSSVGKVRARMMMRIADQIEREHAEDCFRMGERAAEDAEAIAWVRKHGGLDRVKAEWRSRVPYDLYERRRQRLLGHIAECETALGRRNVRIDELGFRVNDLMIENAELRRRAMPEGCEWPRYEDGESVMFWGFAADAFGTALDEPISSVELFENGFTLHGDGVKAFYGYEDRVRRPAVPAGDGEPLEVGQTVWDVYGYGPLVVKAVPSKGEQLVVLDNGGTNFYRYPEKLTHERPDSWERIEEDAKKEACAYFGVEGGGYGCSECPVKQWEESCDAEKSKDLVRRCRALAERGE